MNNKLTAMASIRVNANREQVWNALVDPAAIKQYMFGTNVETDWREGSPIAWKGEWQGKSYEDKGVILQLKPNQTQQYSHFSPLSGQEDEPENYHTVTIELNGDGEQTDITLTQDNNASAEERRHSEQNWAMMLNSLKQYLEK